MIVERYAPEHAAPWDDFVRTSRNGTFLLQRGYMDYHRDRFADHSLLVRDSDGALVAVLPAHVVGDRFVSHGGLSYGGFVVGPGMKTPPMLRVFDAVVSYLRDGAFVALDYKTIPHIYHRQPAEEDRYALYLLGAQTTRRDVLSVVPRGDRLPYQTRRERGVKKARKAGLEVRESDDLAPYWALLGATLAERFKAAPVHTLAEIAQLKQRFPANVRLFTAGATEPVAGVLVYESARVAHCQYIAASPAGRACSALDLLFDHLLGTVYRDHPYFDFGGSHEDGGRAVNAGLIDQKEGFGARSVAHEHFRVDLTVADPRVLKEAVR